ncbi:MAG: hypothetical protein ETSY2_11205 [Candidatus Entotheonella gemina]|uniref:Uncharacterized protein n=1 Tax=Candidatus Entotheonella gemina TaxID=1429439 RepID=W4MCT9_9BACT|nr:MAG: hypothetical protein ETSY2_11205 [Candidatus Entotheonella gemina]
MKRLILPSNKIKCRSRAGAMQLLLMGEPQIISFKLDWPLWV